MPRATCPRTPLTTEERVDIILAVGSAFREAEEPLHEDRPDLRELRFHTPSAGVIARDLSEKIEKAIIQHCESFTQGNGHCDLCRFEQDWAVKICQGSGLTIAQSKVTAGRIMLSLTTSRTRF